MREKNTTINVDKIHSLLKKLDPNNKIFGESNRIYELSHKFKNNKDNSVLEELDKSKVKNRKFNKGK